MKTEDHFMAILLAYYRVEINSDIIWPSVTSSSMASVEHADKRSRIILAGLRYIRVVREIVHEHKRFRLCIHRGRLYPIRA